MTQEIASKRAFGAPAPLEFSRWLALGAVAGPLVLTLAWLVLGALRPGFSHISQPISGLGVGPNAPWMNLAFELSGLLTLAGLVGAFRTIQELGVGARCICIALLAPSPLGGAMDGVFTYQSFFLHFVGFLIAFGTAVPGFLVAGTLLRRIPSWRRFGGWLMLAGPLTLALTGLFLVTFNPADAGAGRGVAGLTERVALIELQAWFAALGWLAFRSGKTV